METTNQIAKVSKEELEKRLAEGKALIQEKPNYTGKSYVAQLYNLYKLLGNVKKHDIALQESFELTETSVKIKKCNAYGVEGRFGGERIKHPAYLAFVKDFDELYKKHEEAIKAMKDVAGYDVAIYPKIVNKVKATAWKASQKA